MLKTFTLEALRSDLLRGVEGAVVDRSRMDKALDLAYRHHEGQFREHRDGGAKRVPYITHPVGVAKIAAQLWPHARLDDTLDDILGACLTHDLLEDTGIDVSELAKATSDRVAALTNLLTKPPVTDGQTREERNRIFLETIVDGGASAKFIKICDASHNLSRPDSMPLTLLAKTIRKAKRDYLPLALDERFGVPIRLYLEEAIGRAECALATEGKSEEGTRTIEQYLSYCVERSSGKTLEAHDVLDILLELPGIRKCHVGTVSDFISKFLGDYLIDWNPGTIALISDKLVESSDLSLTGKPVAIDRIRDLPFDRILAVPLDAGAKELKKRRYFFLGRNSREAPDWVSASSLRAVASVLTERYRDREARELADYSDWIADAAIALDPRLASELRLTRDQIYRLASVYEAATIEVGRLRAAIRAILRQSRLDAAALLAEDRIKSPSSIAMKLVGRAHSDWSMIDDTVGFRLVFLNSRAKRDFIQAFETHARGAESEWRVDIGLDPGTLEIREISSASGYRATHLNFKVPCALSEVGHVACEMQVRTLFEDAWARIAHVIDYKSDSRSSRPLRRDLSELSKICESADTLTDRFSRSGN